MCRCHELDSGVCGWCRAQIHADPHHDRNIPIISNIARPDSLQTQERDHVIEEEARLDKFEREPEGE